MAEENVVKTNIVATSNMSGLISDLNKVTTSLSNLQQQLNATNKQLAIAAAAMSRQFADTLRSTGQFSTHFVSLTSDVDKFGQQLDKGQLKLGQFFNVYKQHVQTSGGLVRQLAQQQVQLQNAILQPLGKNAEGLMQYNVHIPTGLDKVKNSTALARQELAIMNKVVQEGAGQLINWGKNTQWAGRQLTVGLTLPLAAFGKAAATAFKQADEELVRLTKVYGGLSATSSAELMKVRKDVTATAAELSKQYGSSFKDTLALAADIAATGKQGNDLLASIKETTRLSVLGEVDRQEAMKATLAIQTAFKQNTNELSDSINFLNAVENQTSTTLQDLVEAIPKAGPIIKGMGGSVKDLALYLTAMKEGGVSAAEGANALKSALGSLINPTKVATNMFAGFGIDLKGIVTKNAGNLTGTLLELQKALDTLNPLQKQQALEQLFGKFQFARMNALFSNLGKQGSQTLQVLDLMKASTADLANVAGRELSQVTESASGKYRRALEGLKADLATVGDSFLKINTTLINVVDNVLKFVQHLPGPIKSLLSFFGMLTAAAGPVIMLTGVLGNFFGYIIKGISHFRTFFKGAEGWKLLTPEILAANKASNLVEQSMYSDAKAAAALNQALQPLIASYTRLVNTMNAGTIPVNPGFSTPAGTGATPGRQVNINSPYLTPVDTRDFAHMNPVGMMTSAEKAEQSIFGIVPGPKTVNRRISKAPQVYMEDDLPKIQGVTAAGKVSTGVVAGEAAKFHAMTGALGMQTEAEIKALRKEVSRTGLITNELGEAYDLLLPQMQEITSNAAARTRQIVSELQANKITADQARAQIIQLNREIELMMVGAAEQTAAQLGRTINTSQLPVVNQPAYDPNTGKSNMKELFREKRGTRKLLNNIARVLGVKTYGAAYSIETTVPKRLNAGGQVTGSRGNYGNVYNPSQHGAVVPGPNVNYDIIPSDVPVGGFVLNQAASRANPDLVNLAVSGYNAGGQMTPAILTPGETVVDPLTYMSNKEAFDRANATRMALGGGINVSRMNYGTRLRDIIKLVGGMRARGSNAQGFISQILGMEESATKQKYLQVAEEYINKQTRSRSNFLTYSQTSKTLNEKNIPYLNREFEMAGLTPLPYTTPRHLTHWTVSDLLGNGSMISDYMVLYSRTSNLQANRNRLRPIDLIYRDLVKLPGMNKYEAQLRAARIPKDKWDEAETEIDSTIRQHFENEAARRGVDLKDLPYIGDRPETGVTYTFLNDLMPQLESALEKISPNSTKLDSYRALKENTQFRPTSNKKSRTLNNGGLIPGYVGGGILSKANILKKLGALFSVNEGGRGYTVNALPRRLNLKAFDMLPISLKAKKFLYDALVSDVTHRSPKSTGSVQVGPLTQYGRSSKTVRGFGGKDQYDIWQSVSSILKNNPNISETDRAFFAKVNSNDQQMPWYVARGLGMNRGGIIGGRISRTRRNYGITNLGMPTIGPSGQWTGHDVPQKTGGGMGGAMTAGFGLQMAGGMMGGQTGNILLMGGLAMQMAPMIGSFVKWSNKITQVSGGMSRLGSIGTKVLSSLKAGFQFLTGPIGLTIAAITALTIAYMKIKKLREDQGKANRLEFGGTEKSYASVGIKNYVSLADKLKQYNEQLDLNKAKIRSTYESYTKTGATGITYTIQQLSEAIKNAKTNQKDYVDAFNTIDSSQVSQYATSLKAQFVALGLSASDASNQIYAIMKASNKAGQALDAVASSGFRMVTDKVSALNVLLKNLSSNLGKTFNAEEFSRGLDALINGSISYMNSLVGTKNANKEVIDQNDALVMMIDQIGKSQGKNNKLNESQLLSLKKQNIMYSSILGTNETLQSVVAKIVMYQSGMADMVNLAKMGVQESIAFAKNLKVVEDTIAKTFESTKNTKSNPVGKLALALKNAKDAATKAKNAVNDLNKFDQAAIEAKIKQQDKLIKAIDKERNARLKLLDIQQQSADYETNIKAAQIKYQQALAAGDMAQAAQEQLNIQKLTADRQREIVRQSINDQADAKIEKLNAEIERLQKIIDDHNKSVTTAGKTSTSATETADSLQSYMTILEGIITKYAGQKNPKVSELDREAISNLINDMKKSKNPLVSGQAVDWEKKYLTPAAQNIFTGKPMGPDQINGSKFVTDMNAYLNTQNAGNSIFKTAVDKFAAAVDKFGAPTGSFTNPYTVGQGTSISRFGSQRDIGEAGSTWSGYGINSDRQAVKDYAKQKGYKPGEYFETSAGKGKRNLFVVEADGNITRVKANYASGGMIKYFGPGGNVNGPGTGTSDSIPAYLSNGEYVIRASAVQQYGKNFFDGLNAQKFAKGGKAYNPTLGTPDPSQGFLNKLLFGTKYLGNTKVAKNEVPFGPGKVASKLYEIINYIKARNLVAKGMYHGSSDLYGDGYLTGKNIIDSAIARDEHMGMGFFSTSSKAEANLYAGGYNTSTSGDTFGSINKITKIPYGKYIDFNKKIEKQSPALNKLIGSQYRRKDGTILAGYIENLGELLNSVGIKGAIMPRINAGQVPGDIANAQWLAWANLGKGVHVKELAAGGFIGPRYNVPTPATAMVNPMTMGYNNGGSVHRYDVGGLVVNAAQGQNERQIAEYVVQMLDNKNMLNAAKHGRSRSI